MTHTRRTALFIPTMRGGGAERVMLNLACGLAGQGHEIDLVLANATGTYLSLIPDSVRVIDLKAKVVGTAKSAFPALVRYLRQEKPRVLLSALEQANVAALLAKKVARVETQVFISIHNTLSAQFSTDQSGHLQFISRCIKVCYPWADGIVAVSGGAADDVAQMIKIPRERIQVIYNPVISEELLRRAQEPVTHPWFEKGQPPVVLAVGRMYPQKDYSTLIRAFAHLRKMREVRLMILGEGEERAMLESLVQELGVTDDVAMPGFCENPFSYMSNAALLALSSKHEGLPTVLIEALACGTPVVSTDCPSGPREILAGGKHGMLVPVEDPEALGQAMFDTLAREKKLVPSESWQPFVIDYAAEQYSKAMLLN